MSFESWLNACWYDNKPWSKLFFPLLPLSEYYTKRKRNIFLKYPQRAFKASVPVIVVGNITVGGTGKSPMVIALCQYLQTLGYRPGIVSRGYGVEQKTVQCVTNVSTAADVGDEALMMARRTSCPVVVGRQRSKAVQMLLEIEDVDIVISDDGMQHYALQRDIEIAMLDAVRGLGNGYLLPVGPLRESADRLDSVDLIASIVPDAASRVSFGLNLKRPVHELTLKVSSLVNLKTKQSESLDYLQQPLSWHIVAGIGHPERFLNTLQTIGLPKSYDTRWFGDHHVYNLKDIPQSGQVLMTEKDAVKCDEFTESRSNMWFLKVDLELSEPYKLQLRSLLSKLDKV